MEPTRVTSRPSGRATTSAKPECLAPFLRRFAREEDGVIVAFSVYFMLIILFVGAVGVDVMRFESQRSKLQHTLDQAVLAAADLDQLSPPAEVVADYFAKAGLANAELLTTVVDEGLNYREVTATAREVMPTQLSHMLGIAEMTAPAASAAEERVDSVEISMVLDVSGSMGGSRIARLRPAAVSFVDTVLALSDAEDVSISIVPYATQVAAGEALLSQFKTHDDQDYSYCVNFDASDFNETSMEPNSSTSRSYERTQHFDPWYFAEDPQGLSAEPGSGSWWRHTPRYHTLPVCSVKESSQILPLSNNTVALHGQINALDPGGNTSIDIGVKWGAALLDPSLQTVVSNLVASNDIEDAFDGRPLAYTDPNVIKVLVVMTDGQNTSQYMIQPWFRSGQSDVWYDAVNDRYAIYYNNRYHYQPWSGTRSPDWNYWTWNISNVSGSWQNLSYQDLFARVSLRFVDDVLYDNFGSYNWSNSPYTWVSGNTKDNRLQNVCNAAKNNGVVIYTIGFEAPWQGANELEQCASTPSHFFDVRGLEIAEAFSAIAQSISQLKLIQ